MCCRGPNVSLSARCSDSPPNSLRSGESEDGSARGHAGSLKRATTNHRKRSSETQREGACRQPVARKIAEHSETQLQQLTSDNASTGQASHISRIARGLAQAICDRTSHDRSRERERKGGSGEDVVKFHDCDSDYVYEYQSGGVGFQLGEIYECQCA